MFAHAECSSLHGSINGDINGASSTLPSDIAAELEDKNKRSSNHTRQK